MLYNSTGFRFENLSGEWYKSECAPSEQTPKIIAQAHRCRYRAHVPVTSRLLHPLRQQQLYEYGM